MNDIIKKVNNILPKESKIKDFVCYTDDKAWSLDLDSIKTNSESVKIVNEDDAEKTIITLNTNYGIANFKRMMEEVLLPVLQLNGDKSINTLSVRSVYNLFGIKGTAIVSTFPLSSITDPATLDRAQKLIKQFNELDIQEDTKNFVVNTENDNLKWRDLFYVYNLVVNNDMFGELRLTPLFQDYFKEKDTLGFDYVKFTSK